VEQLSGLDGAFLAMETRSVRRAEPSDTSNKDAQIAAINGARVYRGDRLNAPLHPTGSSTRRLVLSSSSRCAS